MSEWGDDKHDLTAPLKKHVSETEGYDKFRGMVAPLKLDLPHETPNRDTSAVSCLARARVQAGVAYDKQKCVLYRSR